MRKIYVTSGAEKKKKRGRGRGETATLFKAYML